MGNTIAFSPSFFPNAHNSRRSRRRHSTDTGSVTGSTATDTNGSINNTKKSKRRKKKKEGKQAWTKREFYSKVKSSPAGTELLSCSFGSWCKRQRIVCGFSDRADYTSNRQPLLKLNGSPTRADTTEGRYFQCHFRSKQELAIYEKESLRSFSVFLPRAVSPQLTEYMRNNRRPGRRHRGIRTSRVVAYHDKFMVVQYLYHQILCFHRSKQELAIYEKESLRSFSVFLPRAVSPQLTEYMRNNRRPGRRHRGIRTSRVVAYHDKFMVVQVNSDQHRPFAKMYLVDLELKTCQGHFVVCHGLRRWYEVYISPSSSCLLLRPDVRYQFQAAPAFSVQNTTWYPPQDDISVRGIPSTLAQHRFTFNARLGDGHVIAAAHRNIVVFKIQDWSVAASHSLMVQFAIVRQIRSSPTGDYLAIRYTFPADGCSFNHILILHYPDFTKAMQIDVRGAYWPVSDLVNLQVFPRFSLSESCLAVMKQRSYSRRVFVYKLPSAKLPSLRQLCRQAILHLVHSKDVMRLPLPYPLQRFLLQPGLKFSTGHQGVIDTN
ncbi:hypothetical protein PoB_004626300 [Plakobranchus ocellatus]|uniref:SOCS box domain-containing protein n=1 Tax=Plakobranchus ocellatus TaxID=259542 RepID=A0AAV4BKT2_9GAST|nr:hypothetical protein PoB_004626300 [Plakobranchus ocellatus]